MLERTFYNHSFSINKTKGTDNTEICRRHLIMTTWWKSSHNIITQPFLWQIYDMNKRKISNSPRTIWLDILNYKRLCLSVSEWVSHMIWYFWFKHLNAPSYCSDTDTNKKIPPASAVLRIIHLHKCLHPVQWHWIKHLNPSSQLIEAVWARAELDIVILINYIR